MKILILGAGQVGSTLATELAHDANDVTVVDSNPEILQKLDDKLDVRTVLGHAAHPHILKQAGIEDTDLLIAVTNNDETNMLACQIAGGLFHTPTKIARVRSNEYVQYQTLFQNQLIPIDFLISPEHLITDYIKRLIEYPGALQVLDFAEGKVQLVGLRALEGAPLCGQIISELRVHMPSIDTRIVALFRQGKNITVQGDTRIEPMDEVFFLAAQFDVRAVINELRGTHLPNRRVMIAGGGHIGARLASVLEAEYSVKIIERDPKRCAAIAEDLHKSIILNGDVADRNLLFNENIEDIDVFCALTNDDATNIMTALLAKQLGARKVMTLVNRPAYRELIEGGSIDVAISPQQTTVSSVLKHIRRGDIAQVYSLRHGAAEAMEAIAHGEKGKSQVVGKAIQDIALPAGATIGAIVRGHTVMAAHHDTVILSDDHVILFLTDKRQIHAVEKLFQVGVYFL